MKFTVTQEDIDKGVRADCWLCPIGRSCARSLPEPLCEISEDSLWIRGAHIGTRRFDLPRNAARFVRRYDDGKAVKPFSFEIPDLNP